MIPAWSLLLIIPVALFIGFIAGAVLTLWDRDERGAGVSYSPDETVGPS